MYSRPWIDRRQRAMLVADDRERRPHRSGARCCFRRTTTSTGIVACCRTFFVCEPRMRPLRPRWPCDAMKMRSQPRASRRHRGSPRSGRSLVIASESCSTPASRATASAFARIARASPATPSLNVGRRDHALSAPMLGRAVVRLRVKERDLRAERRAQSLTRLAARCSSRQRPNRRAEPAYGGTCGSLLADSASRRATVRTACRR